jgi:2,3-bisphosphoglycerate-dependent phosphoglycerate mutase
MEIHVIRHCEATGQSEDAPLTARGFEQAELLANFLEGAGIEQVICSPYLRAQQSIAPLVERNRIPMTVDNRLSERVLSRSPINNWFECLRNTFDDFELSFAGGESSKQAMERAVATLSDVNATNLQSVAIMTHGNLMTLLLRHFDSQFGFDEWTRLTNPDVFLVSVDAAKRVVKRVWGGVL